MRHVEKQAALCSLCFAALGALCAPAPAWAEVRAIAVIVDRDNPRSDIGVEELRSLFLGKRHDWSDGARAVPVDLDTPGPRRAFCSTVLGMTEADFDRYWVDQRVRGAGTGPRMVASPRLAVRLVARVRGAVGFVPLDRVDGTVKVLTVGGLAPGQPGYPIVGNLDAPGAPFSQAIASAPDCATPPTSRAPWEAG